jgi:hypothetical protein
MVQLHQVSKSASEWKGTPSIVRSLGPWRAKTSLTEVFSSLHRPHHNLFQAAPRVDETHEICMFVGVERNIVSGAFRNTLAAKIMT